MNFLFYENNAELADSQDLLEFLLNRIVLAFLRAQILHSFPNILASSSQISTYSLLSLMKILTRTGGTLKKF